MEEPLDINPYQAPASGAGYGDGPADFGPRSDAEVSPRSVELLAQTQPWVRFISVLTFIGFGLLMTGIVVGLMFSMSAGASELLVVFAMWLAIGALMLAPAVFLGKYASHIASLRISHRVYDLENALQAQKSCWKFIGVLFLVMLVLYVIGILGFVLGGAYWFASSSSRF